MVRVIGHRGASAAHPENTIEAFEGAKQQGAAGIELDVRLSADDVLMVHHDAHLGDGRLIRAHDADGLPDSVPTLVEALDVAEGMWVNIEIKNAPDEPDFDQDHRIALAVAGLVSAYFPPGQADPPMAERVVVSSFNVDTIRRIREVDPTIPVALLVWGQADPVSLIARAVGHGFDAIHPHDLLVDRSFVDKAHGDGLAVNVWTVDDPKRVVELAELGVDGIITNKPDAAIDALRAAGIDVD